MNALIFLSSDDSEEEVNAVNLAVHRRTLRSNLDLFEISDVAFVSNFRVSKALFTAIHSKIASCLARKHMRGFSSQDKLAATLKFLAQRSYQQGVGNDFTVAIGQSMFSDIFHETLCALEKEIGIEVTVEMTQGEKAAARRYFYEKSGIPGVVMCVDGTHIRITAPKDNKESFYNRKGFYSMNAMMLCDRRKLIRFVNAKFHGSHHDSYVYSNSPVANYFEEKWRNGERQFKLLADSAYPSKPWIIKPHRNANQNSPEAEFNEKHAKARSIIERTFGMLKNKFQCLCTTCALCTD
ncbi:putative nuclease HARBI1 [Anopheles ziemanni]|uniref:putative nuclease HARBI1 n=1 Tax=Anopheles coustani TaxID=139045 RepID=UPI00265B57C3|nr:putative nuclease HARBI1 [Anopheles coustani]XP_058177853.1 putative nuclease HARBI1 [Anopheles ziemanni]